MRAYLAFTAFETKLFFREFVAVFFTLVVPGTIAIVVSLRQPDAAAVVGIYQRHMPEIVAVLATLVAMYVLAGNLVVDRELGFFKRILATPVGPGTIAASAVTRGLIVVTLATLEILAVSFALGGGIPRFDLIGFAIAMLIGCTTLFLIGFALASMISRPPTMFVVANISTQLLVLATPFGLAFIGAPQRLQPLALANPLTQAIMLLSLGWEGRLFALPSLAPLGALVGFCLISLLIVRRNFTWIR